jgi:hypothetical protein
MLNVARKRAAKLSMHVSFPLADAEVLPFADHCFDTVVSSLSACTLQIRRACFERWRAFVERTERSCYWTMAEATASGLDVGTVGMILMIAHAISYPHLVHLP